MPKRVPPLSAKTLAAVRPSGRLIELVDGYVAGLRVRVLPSGTRTWSLNIRDSRGVRRRFDVGADLSLSEARRKAEQLRKSVRDGADPTLERRTRRLRAQAAGDGVGTFRALLENYFTKGPGSQRRKALRTRQIIQTVFEKVLDDAAVNLDRAKLQLLADSWRSAQTAALAVRCLRPCLKWAERRTLVSPGAADLEPPAQVGKRSRVLTNNELRAIWPHLGGAHGQVIKWLLWTGCRLSEATGMTWGEVENDLWTIPSTRRKNGQSHTVPLPRQAGDMLRTAAIHREESQSGSFVFPSTRARQLSNWGWQTKRLHRLSGTSGWHRHDLRRTVATLLGDLGFAPHVVSVVLGHAHIAQGATAVYARSRYQREHREALQALADEIDRIVSDVDNVVRLSAVQK
jgi:integrase